MAVAPSLAGSCDTPLRIACIGDSLTRGDGSHEAWHRGRPPKNLAGRGNYPAILASLLGAEHFRVENFGHGGTTACNSSDAPYARTREFRRAIRFRPHLVILMLGTNDAKDGNWDARCRAGATMLGLGIDGILSALGTPPPPTLLLEPPPILREKWRIRQRHLTHARRAVRWHSRSGARAANRTGGCASGERWLAKPLAKDLRSRLWRYFTPDGVHLNQHGSRLVACASLEALHRCEGSRLGASPSECTFQFDARAVEKCRT